MRATAHPRDPSQLRRLTDVVRAVSDERALPDVLLLATECAAELFSSRAAVLLLAGPDHLLRVAAAHGIDDRTAAAFREPLDERLLSRLEAFFGTDAPRHFLGVPVVVAGRIEGVLALRCAVRGAADEWLLAALADQAALAIETARRHDERASLERQVRRMEQERSHTDRALRIAGHDIRTPLNAMQGYISLLQGGVVGPVNERQAQMLARVQAIGKHLVSVLDNVLEMARLAAGAQPVELEDVELDAAATEAVFMGSALAGEKAIEVRTALDCGRHVRADADRLQQVLLQLLDNAIKYSPSATVVTVATAVEEIDGRTWGVIRVADEGPGVPAHLVADIFQPGFRLPSERSDDPGGTGLGLAIAKSLVELMGGNIDLDAAATAGTTIRIRLRLADSAP